jgi:hypothetical protein
MPHKHTTQPEWRERFWLDHFDDELIERAIRNAQKRVNFVFWRGKPAVLRAVKAAVLDTVYDLDSSLGDRAPYDDPDRAGTPPPEFTVHRGGAA